MEIIVILAVLAVLITVFKKPAKKFKRYANSDAYQSYNYKKHARLFSPAERSFLGVLDLAVGNEYRIFAKVRVADVIEPERGLTRKNWQIAFNRVAGKHFDYVLCSPDTLEIKAVLELDDTSHSENRRISRDEFLQKACKSAGLKLIRIKAQRNYNIETIRQNVNGSISKDNSLGGPKPPS